MAVEAGVDAHVVRARLPHEVEDDGGDDDDDGAQCVAEHVQEDAAHV